jgi:hypothetical protein
LEAPSGFEPEMDVLQFAEGPQMLNDCVDFLTLLHGRSAPGSAKLGRAVRAEFRSEFRWPPLD